MENSQLKELISESARLEENVSRVYLKLAKLFTDDGGFWLQMYAEEKNHSEIFKNFLNGKLPLNLFPEGLVGNDLQKIRRDNENIEEKVNHLLEIFRNKTDAYNYALQLEDLLTEIKYQEAMEKESDSESLYLIQRINKDEMDHKKRIRELLDEIH